MKEAFIVSIETQSPSTKLLRIKTNGPFSEKDKEGLFFNPGQSIMIKAWGYGKKIFPIASSPYEGRFLEIFTKRGDRFSETINSFSNTEPLLIDDIKNKGFPIKDIENKDILIITDSFGIAAAHSFLPHLSKNKKLFGKTAIIYNIEEESEILYKNELQEIKEKFNFIINSNSSNTAFNEKIEYNPLKTKTLLCVSENKIQYVLKTYIKPLGISYRDVFIWSNGKTNKLIN
ncbi:hypothetical protein C4553_01000 [Candidatus Parcubacteria bacterium]|nr:MAG: hypothetical protein C4553_01000 [Candidatus Parcubacteria bacterium]